MVRNGQKVINLALQGGGAHGAYAWGVIDYLLEDGRVAIEGVTATSAGTMNALALAHGLHTAGRDGARQALHNLWHRLSEAGRIFSPVRQLPWESWMKMWSGDDRWNMDTSPLYDMFEMFTRMFSPYQFNLFNVNPLRDVIGGLIDFDVIQGCDSIKLFISATNVRTGRAEIFKNADITLDVAMASACLPYLFKAVEINNEHYWDGGYMGNPALFPLFYNTETRDIVIVHINPIERDTLPVQSDAIANRINEISFNSSLLQELRAVAFVVKLLEEDWLKPEYRNRLKNVLVHSIRADQSLLDLSVSSKFNTDWDFLCNLRDRGRAAAMHWLEATIDDIGVRSSVHLRREYLNAGKMA